MMMEVIPSIERVSRTEVIARLRARLGKLAERDHCVCETAGRLGVFCKGFRRLSDPDFRQRFDSFVRRRKAQPRPAVEALVGLDHWKRTDAAGASICCDLETRQPTVCAGWNRFDAATLERYHLALVGSPVRIS